MRISMKQLVSFYAGTIVALVLAACAMAPSDQERKQPAQTPGPTAEAARPVPAATPAPAGGVTPDRATPEQIVVTGNRIDDGERSAGVSRRREEAQRASGGAASAATANEESESLAELLEQVRGGVAADTSGALQRQQESGRRETQEEFRRSQTLAATAGLASPTLVDALPDSPLARVLAGEEVWIISQPEVADDSSVDDDVAPGTGALLAHIISDDSARSEPEMVPLPLRHTDVHATIRGYVGTVDVTQQFENPFSRKIEAVYVFPLPEKAAISEFVMTIGERRIRGILREREEAEQIYAQARAQGYQASLLTQHRPNIFEQKVANIEPGHRIDVDIRYFHTLAYRDGWYSFVFPTVVGPRYNPPGSTNPVLALPRAQFQPASSAAVRYLKPTERSGHDISIEVDLDAGVAVEELTASHEIRSARSGPTATTVSLARRATIPNRDFELNFRVAGDTIKSSLLSHVDEDNGQGYFTAMIYPPAGLESLDRQSLELVFVLDCSGSMQGEPLAQAKDAVVAALDRLRPDDTFQIIRFSVNASQFGNEPLHATPENLRAARQYLRGLNGGGGTQMIEGIKAALDFTHDPERLRFVTFLTDGYIGNEIEILGAIHERLGASRIFSFGVGSSVNRYLLERMAGVGRGAVAYLGLQDSGGSVMNDFFDRISHPALLDVEIDWGQMSVTDIYPARLPDLFVGRPVVVTGKFSGEPRAPTVRGRAAGERIAFDVGRDADGGSYAFLPKLWGRLRIAELNDQRAWVSDPQGEIPRAIRATALEYGLMSDYTSFVAVDASRVTDGAFGTTVFQAVPVPDGVRYETTVSP